MFGVDDGWQGSCRLLQDYPRPASNFLSISADDWWDSAPVKRARPARIPGACISVEARFDGLAEIAFKP